MTDVAIERSTSFPLFALWSNLEEAYSTLSTIFKATILSFSVPYAPVYPLKHLWEKFNSFSVIEEINP